MCWIIWIISKRSVVEEIYDWLTLLQHRWQDAAWINTFEWKHIFSIKGQWLVREVINQYNIGTLQWNVWIWHCRYPTAWTYCPSEAQPFYVNSPYWISLVHNWNLTNTEILSKEIFQQDLRHLATSSDSEILLNIVAHELSRWKKHLNWAEIFEAFSWVYSRISWAYAAIAYVFDHWLIAFRDPYGIRPLCYGQKEENWFISYVFASESVAVTSLWYNFVRDLYPWEVVIVGENWKLESKICSKISELTPCLFEHIYLARPDSIIDTISVHKARQRLWDNLWKKIKQKYSHLDIDVVIPIPDTSRTSALQVAQTLDITYREWFIKNRYIWRTFIMPWQEVRKRSIRQKLNPIWLEFKNKNVLLVDDSIVRWNTSREIIKMAKMAWAKKVYFASTAPEVKYPNVYWIDMYSRNELIAWRLNSNKEIAAEIWADEVIYQDLEGIETIVSWWKNVYSFEMSCFNWIYCTWDIDKAYLARLEKHRATC